jgi:hypothetical protein
MSKFKFSPAAVPQTPVTVEGPESKPSRAVESVVPPSRYTDRSDWSSKMFEYDAEAKRAVAAHPMHSELNCILMLIKPDRWMKGLWSEIENGWHEHRTNTDLTFDGAKVLIANRIEELHLNPELVYSYPHSHEGYDSAADYMAFLNAPFDVQMAKFKESKA